MSEKRKDEYITPIGEGEHVSVAILRAIAAVSNRPILDLPPLADSIDADSVDRIFASPTPPESLRFSYEGYLVTVEQGQVRIHTQR